MWQNRGEVLSALILKHFPSHQKFYFRFWKVRKKIKRETLNEWIVTLRNIGWWMHCLTMIHWMHVLSHYEYFMNELSYNETLDGCIVTLSNIWWMNCPTMKTLDGCIVTLRNILWMNCPTMKHWRDALSHWEKFDERIVPQWNIGWMHCHIKRYTLNELSHNETMYWCISHQEIFDEWIVLQWNIV